MQVTQCVTNPAQPDTSYWVTVTRDRQSLMTGLACRNGAQCEGKVWDKANLKALRGRASLLPKIG